MLAYVSGEFVKIVFAHDVDVVLSRGLATRPAARFNRAGQDALYLSPNEASARVALTKYLRPEDAPRVLLRFEVAPCVVFDLRHPDAAAIHRLAKQPWGKALEKGDTPPSWTAADRIRADGHVGLIDPSRQQPNLWHLTLFRWNDGDAPLGALDRGARTD
jgi:RES domain-containing protein